MIVYCSSVVSFACPFDHVLDQIVRWLAEKTGFPRHLIKSTTDKETALTKEGHRLEFKHLSTDEICLQAIRYIHPDPSVHGRQWITEIGLRQYQHVSQVECSILLKTEEISIRVDQPIAPVRPKVIRRLFDHCSPTEATPGAALRYVDEANATDFLRFIDSTERTYPVILITPRINNDYAFFPEYLLLDLAGLADVVQISPTADFSSVRTLLGDEYSVWNGEINIIYPRDQRGVHEIAPIYRLTHDEIETMLSSADGTAPQQFLALLTHRVNSPNSRRHISFDYVKDERRRWLLNTKRRELQASGEQSKEQQEFQKLFEEENQSLEQRLKTLQDEASYQDKELDNKNEQIRLLKLEIDMLKQSHRELTTSLQFAQASVTLNLAEKTQQDLIIGAINQQLPVKKALEFVATAFPDRLIVLSSAYASAEQSEEFKHLEKAQELLIKLVTTYWEAISNGGSDKTAGDQIFGKTDFAPRESESVENNARARALRTFSYKGKNVVMFKHLKHGVKANAQDTIRIHFHWDAEDKKIVIGHCGPHLDHD